MTEQELADMIDKAVVDERERCRLLVRMRGEMARASAARTRAKGSFTTRALWPLFKKVTFVAPRFEKVARDMDAVADAFDVVARAIANGYDVRKLECDPNEKVNLSRGQWKEHPAPKTEAERVDAVKAAHGVQRECGICGGDCGQCGGPC